MNREDLLQERLDRLEGGEPLETCRVGLPDEEADLLRVAASFRSISYPSRMADHVAAQRASLLRAPIQHNRPTSQRAPQPALRFPWKGGTRSKALPELLVLAAGCALILVLCAASLVLQQISQSLSTAQRPSPGPSDSYLVSPTPIASSVLVVPNPSSAIIADARGMVEMQASDGKWAVAKAGQVIQVGQRVRTSELSNATLLFYDKSQARLGPMTEVSVDKLDAQVNGPRIVRLTQWIGEADHDVTPSNDTASRYEVNTPNGTGSAKGTSFHVSVSTSQITRITVDEGAVAATNLDTTVIVIAGQVTTIRTGAPPAQPVFRVTGEGVVTQMGNIWRIGDLEFRTDANTIIIGNPQIGDLVAVEGHLLSDGTRVAERIVLLRRAPSNRFAFTGTVNSIGDTQWTISGRPVRVNRDTDIMAGIKIGGLVNVEGIIQPDGTLLAEHIRPADVKAGLPFEFTGLVQSIVSKTWTISGVPIAVDVNTHIDPGLAAGDVVKVEGRILPSGTWLAASIQRAAPQEREFEFTGVVQSMAPWVVSGISFQTDGQTEIEAGIKIGDRVKVQGRVLDDGTWLAEEIKRLDDGAQRFQFVGRVIRINPWIVGGVPISVTGQTAIDPGIGIGDLVSIEGRVLSDGTLLAEEIKRLDTHAVCVDTYAIVINADGDQIVLQDGQIIQPGKDTLINVRGDGKQVKRKDDGKVDAGSVVIVRVCVRADGKTIIVSITIIQLPDWSPPVGWSPPTGLCINPAGKVKPCPPGNPPPFGHLDGDEDDKDKRPHGKD